MQVRREGGNILPLISAVDGNSVLKSVYYFHNFQANFRLHLSVKILGGDPGGERKASLGLQEESGSEGVQILQQSKSENRSTAIMNLLFLGVRRVPIW